MNFAPSSSLVRSQTSLDRPKTRAPSFDATVAVASLAFSIALAVAIYLDATAPDKSPDDLAMIIVFP